VPGPTGKNRVGAARLQSYVSAFFYLKGRTMNLRFVALPTDDVAALQTGRPDANGQVPERHVSDGDGMPCRHCLKNIDAGEPYLILAYRPFPKPQPYAELGPIFLHAEACPRFDTSDTNPSILTTNERYLIRGYGGDDRIVYGSGKVVPRGALAEEAESTLQDARIAYVHVRSATNNCYQCRVERR
jgi:Protein of unknown function (DUF1203)